MLMIRKSNITINDYLQDRTTAAMDIIRACYKLSSNVEIPKLLTDVVIHTFQILEDISKHITYISKKSQKIDICPFVDPVSREINYDILLHNLRITKRNDLYSVYNTLGPIVLNVTYENVIRAFELFDDLKNYKSLDSQIEPDFNYELKQYLFRRKLFIKDDTPEIDSSLKILNNFDSTCPNGPLMFDTQTEICIMSNDSNKCTTDKYPFRLFKVSKIFNSFITDRDPNCINPFGFLREYAKNNEIAGKLYNMNELKTGIIKTMDIELSDELDDIFSK